MNAIALGAVVLNLAAVLWRGGRIEERVRQLEYRLTRIETLNDRGLGAATRRLPE